MANNLNSALRIRLSYHGPPWTAKEKWLLGKLPDSEVARRAGRTLNAVRIKRTRARLANARDERRGRGG